MVNYVQLFENQILYGLAKKAGLRHQMVEIKPGTTISFLAPKETKKKKKKKPAVVLVHGFFANGIFTWSMQIPSLARHYSVYVPDLLFFGRSTTTSSDRSPGFQAECLASALGQLGVTRCAVVGFSYGGTVALKMAEERPELVRSVVVSGAVPTVTDSISRSMLERTGLSSPAELLLPDSVKGLKAGLPIVSCKNIWFPEFVLRDFLKVMFDHRKERKELLEGLEMSNRDAKLPNLQQKMYLLWGENDNIFNLELAKNMKEQVGEKATLQSIEKAGHLVHLERPCVYNRRLKELLALAHAKQDQS